MESLRPEVTAEKAAAIASAGLDLTKLRTGELVANADIMALVDGCLTSDLALKTMYEDVASLIALEDLTAVFPMPPPPPPAEPEDAAPAAAGA